MPAATTSTFLFLFLFFYSGSRRREWTVNYLPLIYLFQLNTCFCCNFMLNLDLRAAHCNFCSFDSVIVVAQCPHLQVCLLKAMFQFVAFGMQITNTAAPYRRYCKQLLCSVNSSHFSHEVIDSSLFFFLSGYCLISRMLLSPSNFIFIELLLEFFLS